MNDAEIREMVQWIADLDYLRGDNLCLKLGGDGDNGEYLIELLTQYFAARKPNE